MIQSTNRWLICGAPRPNALVRLLTIPSAGSGSGLFHGWGTAFPPWAEVWTVLAPGRETRFSEPIPTTLEGYVAPIVEGLTSLQEIPLALFGHSMGGTLAYEVARTRIETGTAPPLRLFISSRRAPSLPARSEPDHLLADTELLEVVRTRWGGFPSEVERYPDVLQMALGVLRADLMALETHRRTPTPPLPVPISALGGDRDPSLPLEELIPWQDETTAGFELRVFSGDHRYLEKERSVLLEYLRKALRRDLRGDQSGD
jgi:surfactin synthase thioesterase subunit